MSKYDTNIQYHDHCLDCDDYEKRLHKMYQKEDALNIENATLLKQNQELKEMLVAWFHAWKLDGPKYQAWKNLHDMTEALLKQLEDSNIKK